jgi:hypothetical protein
LAQNLTAVQKEFQRMAAATPRITLIRLTEQWGNASDASFYKELEVDKKRWMLSALYGLDKALAAFGADGENNRLAIDFHLLALFDSEGMRSHSLC